jgi:hypothetical protein
MRLAQRVPVRIHIDQVPDGVRLVAGMTATVQNGRPHPVMELSLLLVTLGSCICRRRKLGPCYS